MKRKLLFQFLILFLVFGAALAKPDAQPSTLLWSVTPKNEPNKVLYLLGSIHIGSNEMYPLKQEIMEAWNVSDVLGVEININNINIYNSEISLTTLSQFYSLDNTLESQLPPNVYEKLRDKMIEAGIPDYLIDTFTPLGAVFTLGLSEMDDEYGYDVDDKYEYGAAYGIDQYFLYLATESNKNIIEMESVEGQLGVLSKLNEFIIPYISYIVDNIDVTSKYEVKKLYSAWSNGDVKDIEKLLNTPFSSDASIDSAIRDVLIFQRNIDIAKKIEGLFAKSETHFIVIGAGHLVGNGSVIDILQKSGKYKIKRK